MTGQVLVFRGPKRENCAIVRYCTQSRNRGQTSQFELLFSEGVRFPALDGLVDGQHLDDGPREAAFLLNDGAKVLERRQRPDLSDGNIIERRHNVGDAGLERQGIKMQLI